MVVPITTSIPSLIHSHFQYDSGRNVVLDNPKRVLKHTFLKKRVHYYGSLNKGHIFSHMQMPRAWQKNSQPSKLRGQPLSQFDCAQATFYDYKEPSPGGVTSAEVMGVLQANWSDHNLEQLKLGDLWGGGNCCCCCCWKSGGRNRMLIVDFWVLVQGHVFITCMCTSVPGI